MAEFVGNRRTLIEILNTIPDELIKPSQEDHNSKWLQYKMQALSQLTQTEAIDSKSKLWKKLSELKITSRINSPSAPEIIEGDSFENSGKWSGVIEIDPQRILFTLNPELKKAGVIFSDISSQFGEHAKLIGDITNQFGDRLKSRLNALTAATANHEVILYIPKNIIVEKPFKISIKTNGIYNFFPFQLFIDLKSFSSAKLVVEFISGNSSDGEIFSPTLFEGRLDNGASLELVEIQALSSRVLFFPNERIQVGKNASLNWFVMDKGSQVTQRTLSADNNQPGGEAAITGVYLPTQNQRFFYDTKQNHLASNTISNLLFKGVLDESAYALWQGNILVKKGINGSDGYQLNNNLLLSPSAHVQSLPGLEICTDDVKCSHGVTISDVDKEQLFYLKTRGIDEREGKALIVDGFIQAAISRVKSKKLRIYVNEFLGSAEPIFDN